MHSSTNTINSLSLLFHKEGFSFCAYDENGNQGKVSHFKVTHSNRWEIEVIKELEINLRLRRNYENVSTAFVSSFFNLIPDSYSNISSEVLLNLSEAEFENNAILKNQTKYESAFVYGTSQLVLDKLNELYGKINFHHSGQVFLNSILFSKQSELHLNHYQNQLEVVITNEKGILFYNLFEVQSDEDILFYTLFALEQLDLDANKIELKCYGKLLPGTSVYQTLKKYIRYVSPAIKNEEFLENYTLLNLIKCASSPEVSEEKE
ncbi:DUF3822 family protein [Moheibacter sediminis]|uniref:DUF3822 domain-containing protein n=1 Tax=Moheibacter sediminis TaxID=1434700 RepID=A0A1W1ZXH2_9FLAO|nr:DUF3822 family protein [Moheibacter sediminis]SMC53169.1 Protein of unknown function [Moheibacter sediminis]